MTDYARLRNLHNAQESIRSAVVDVLTSLQESEVWDKELERHLSVLLKMVHTHEEDSCAGCAGFLDYFINEVETR